MPQNGPITQIGHDLKYTIRFQNYGNYPAGNVVIRDTLDDQLDPRTLKILAASHDVITNVEEGNMLVFTFPDIYLPPEEEDKEGSYGYVRYRISPHSGLSDHTFIHNTAHIYFDANPVVVTNTTENILVSSMLLNTEDLNEFESRVQIFPNPAKNEVFFKWINQIPSYGELHIYGTRGKRISSFMVSKGDQEILVNTRTLEPGIYFPELILASGQKSWLPKLIIMK